MSAATELVTCVRSRLANSGLETTSAEVAHAVREDAGAVRDPRRVTRQEFVRSNPLCPPFRTVSAFVVPYGVFR